MALATWAWQPLRGSLWVLEHPYFHPMVTQTHTKPVGRFSEKVQVQPKKIFDPPLPQQSSGVGGLRGQIQQNFLGMVWCSKVMIS